MRYWPTILALVLVLAAVLIWAGGGFGSGRSGAAATVKLQETVQPLLALDASLPQHVWSPETDSGSIRDEAGPLVDQNHGAAAGEDEETPPALMEVDVLVTDRADSPIAAARIRQLRDPIDQVLETDATGHVNLSVPVSQDPIPLRVEADGFVHQQAHWTLLPELHIRLASASTLRAQLIDAETERPLVGARIQRVHSYCRECSPAFLMTGPGGWAEIREVPLGESSTFLLRAKGFVEQFQSLHLRDTGAEAEYVFRLHRGIEISGRVVDAQTGSPVSDARVGNAARQDEVRSAYDGRFTLQTLLEGQTELRLRFEHADYCTLKFPWTRSRAEPLIIPALRSCSLEGVVRDFEGVPVAGVRLILDWDPEALVTASESENTVTAKPRWLVPGGGRLRYDWYGDVVQTDREGRFRFAGVVPGPRPLQVTLRHASFWEATEFVAHFPDPGESRWREFQLRLADDAATVHGQVRLNGKPVEGYVTWRGPTRMAGQRVDETGSYRLEKAEPAAGTLHISLEDYREVPALRERVEVMLRLRPGEEHRHDFELQHSSGSLRGRVLQSDGRPAVDVWVFASSDSGRGRQRGRTASDGRFEIEALDVAEPYTVSALQGREHVSREGVFPGMDGIDLQFLEQGKLLLRILDADTDQRIPDAEVFWRRTSEDSWIGGDRIVSDPEGWLEIVATVGPVELMVYATDHGYAPGRFQGLQIPTAGREVRHVFRLRQGVEVEIRLAADCEPLPREAVLYLIEEEAWEGVRHRREAGVGGSLDGGDHFPMWTVSERQVRFGATGRDRLRGLPPGRYRFKLFFSELALDPTDVELTGDTPQTIELCLHH